MKRTRTQTVPDAGLGQWSIHELRHLCASLLIAMEAPLEAVAEQMGHASIRVTKDVYGHLMPRSRARAAEAMRTILYDDSPVDSPKTSNALATSLATSESGRLNYNPLTRTLVGRPGLDPGTLGANMEQTSMSLNVQICWSNEEGRSPSFAEVSRSLISWLDDWLDNSSYVGLANVRINPFDG